MWKMGGRMRKNLEENEKEFPRRIWKVKRNLEGSRRIWKVMRNLEGEEEFGR